MGGYKGPVNGPPHLHVMKAETLPPTTANAALSPTAGLWAGLMFFGQGTISATNTSPKSYFPIRPIALANGSAGVLFSGKAAHQVTEPDQCRITLKMPMPLRHLRQYRKLNGKRQDTQGKALHVKPRQPFMHGSQ